MKKLLKIYGERNTNTNYLSRLVKLNLDINELPGVVPPYMMLLQYILPGKESVRDLYFDRMFEKNLGWKHGCVMPATALNDCELVKNNRVNFLTITKNPYSWLLSLHRKPYHQYYSKKPDLETFLRTPWKTVGRDNTSGMLNSPMDLWNVKNASYLSVSDNFSGLNITTENIFHDPAAVIDKLASHFSIEKKSQSFLNYEKSTKDKKKNSTFYRDYYINEHWRKDLSREAIDIINQSLDRKLVEYFGYEFL